MFLTFFTINKMASAVAMMIGGAVVNALAFTGGNFLFSKLGKTQDAEKERERHNRAVEQLEAAQAAWSQKRMQRLDFLFLLLAVPRRLFCFGFLVILDVARCYLWLFTLYINIKISKNSC